MRIVSLTAAALALVASAGAATPTVSAPSGWIGMSTATPVTPASADTCAGIAARYDAAAKAHATSANLLKADEEAAAGKTACADGKSADGIADYQAALKLLGA